MDLKNNILYAKKHLVDNIFSSVKVEGLAMTFPETKTILENGRIAGKSYDEIDFVNDMKHAWEYIFENIDQEINLNTVKKLNQIAGRYTVINAGMIRSIFDEPVCIYDKNGKNVWTPEMPPKQEIIQDNIEKILNNDNKQDAALDLYLYIAKGQFFNDGNKRTATLACNMELIQNGLGIFQIPVDHILEFNELLIDYYQTDDNSKITEFFKGKCIKCQKEYPFGQKIQMLRERNNIDRNDFSEIIHIGRKELFDIERSSVIPSEEVINRIANFFNIDAEQIEPSEEIRKRLKDALNENERKNEFIFDQSDGDDGPERK